MKKLLITTSLLVLFSNQSFAKTSGNYLGIDLNRTSSHHKYSAATEPSYDNSKIGFGVSYKHAFNFNDFFVAPGIFFDKIGTSAKDLEGDYTKINNRYGAKLDIGYDITDKFAAYFTNGIAAVKYSVNWDSVEAKRSGTKLGYFYGAGVAYRVADNFTVNFEYNNQSLDLATPETEIKSNTRIGMAKIGLAYNF